MKELFTITNEWRCDYSSILYFTSFNTYIYEISYLFLHALLQARVKMKTEKIESMHAK